jgi:Ca2+-transporting ATPase
MQKTFEELKNEFGIESLEGLNDSKVLEQREKYGENALKEKKKQSILVKFLLEFKDALIIILLIAAVVSLIVDPEEWVESLIIFLVVIFNAVLGVYQEGKAEKSLESLKKMSSPTCKVFRNGVLITIPTKELVVGDVISVEAGDFIPADAKIISCSNLKVDESALTGESVAVDKDATEILDHVVGLGDMKNCLFSSTFITNGKAIALVTGVGMNTEIGKIAGALMESEDTETPLQKKLTQVGKVIGIMALAICVVVFVLNYVKSNNFLEAFKIAISLAVAAIPEGLATVVTIVLAIGVEKMAKHNAIVKKLPAVETLGSTNVICSDKTGTLTQNKMTVVNIYKGALKELNNLNDEEKQMLLYFATCCDASISFEDGKEVRIGDPTELALLDANNLYGKNETLKRVIDLPFDSDRKLMTTVVELNGKYLAITKGAPDIVISKSINDKEILDAALVANNDLATNAIRVLALGIKWYEELPDALELEQDLEFIGLVGMIDPARDEVKDAIAIANKAGIATVMITGDHVTTAKAIALQLGILHEGELAITSAELAKISDEELLRDIEKYRVYARVSPNDKVRIVSTWKEKGYIAAMTGDGVNDAPALKKADIGCAMGITGTDVSKEAADMILTDDNFTTIVEAVKQGRGIFANIQKCVKYLLSSNIGEVITIFVASLLVLIPALSGLGTPLSPIHLLWINLITDSLPAFGLGMEEPEDDVMDQKPRGAKEGFFSNGLMGKIIFEGICIGLLTLSAYLVGHLLFDNHVVGQTMAFLTLSSTQLFHAFNVKNKHTIFSKHTFDNKFLNMAFIVGFLLQLFVIYCPGLNTVVFKFVALSLPQLLISIALALVIVVIMEVSKLFQKNNK